ncbi:MAG TPA: hypothetical protein VM939_05190 [Gemmatimonadaceae bacterium]|nr:hypothetical protein [Gemmatimonadaceae bacterium]
MLAVLVAVTGFVAKSLMVSWHHLNNRERHAGDKLKGIEDRLQKIEAATSSLLVDMSSIREKQRFMSQLQPPPKEVPNGTKPAQGEMSPLVTQNIPIVPRVGSPRQY